MNRMKIVDLIIRYDTRPLPPWLQIYAHDLKIVRYSPPSLPWKLVRDFARVGNATVITKEDSIVVELDALVYYNNIPPLYKIALIIEISFNEDNLVKSLVINESLREDDNILSSPPPINNTSIGGHQISLTTPTLILLIVAIVICIDALTKSLQ